MNSEFFNVALLSIILVAPTRPKTNGVGWSAILPGIKSFNLPVAQWSVCYAVLSSFFAVP